MGSRRWITAQKRQIFGKVGRGDYPNDGTSESLIAGTDSGKYPDGVWVVDLASVGEPQRVTTAPADTLDIEMRAPERARLLVLDNCDQ